jgi:hypothetical protein
MVISIKYPEVIVKLKPCSLIVKNREHLKNQTTEQLLQWKEELYRFRIHLSRQKEPRHN